MEVAVKRCAKCGRKLKREPVLGQWGPVCARAILGAKPKRPALFDRRPAKPDARQAELFGALA